MDFDDDFDQQEGEEFEELQELEELAQMDEQENLLADLEILEHEENGANPTTLLSKVKKTPPIMSHFELTSLIIRRAQLIAAGYGSIYSEKFIIEHLKNKRGGLSSENIAKFEVETYLNKIKYLRDIVKKDKLEYSDIPEPILGMEIPREGDGLWFLHEFKSFPPLSDKRVFIDEKQIYKFN